jgi:hypothetical protein
LKWLRLDAEKNALDYLTRTVEFLEEANFDSMAWKWVVLGLFGALYGFATCALQGTNPERVQKAGKLISFDEAMSRCRNARFMKMLVGSRTLVLTRDQKHALRRLKDEHRDVFEHFRPHARSVEMHQLPGLAIELLPVVRFLALDTGNFVQLNSSQKRRVRSLVHRGIKLAKEHKLHRELHNSTPRGK